MRYAKVKGMGVISTWKNIKGNHTSAMVCIMQK